VLRVTYCRTKPSLTRRTLFNVTFSDRKQTGMPAFRRWQMAIYQHAVLSIIDLITTHWHSMSRNTHRTDYIKWPCNAALITAEPQIRCLQPARKQSQRAIIIRTCTLSSRYDQLERALSQTHRTSAGAVIFDVRFYQYYIRKTATI